MRIFILDVFKQVASASALHLINVVLAVLVSDWFKPPPIFVEPDTKDQCASYLVSVLMDSTIGVIIVILVLRASLHFVRRKRLDYLEQGNYLDRNGEVIMYNYAAQTAIWISVNLAVS